MSERGFLNEMTSLDFSGFSEYPSAFLLYEDGSQRDQAVESFFLGAFEKNAELICLCEGEQRENIHAALRQHDHFVQGEVAGRFKVASMSQLFASSERSSQLALEWIRKARVDARARGYSGIWIFLEMACLPVAGEAWLREFVAGIDRLVPEGGLFLFSAVNCRDVPPMIVLETLRHFPAIVQGGQVVPNHYYGQRDSSKSLFRGMVEQFWGMLKALARGGRNKKNLQPPYRRGQVFDAILKVAPIGMWLLDKNHRMAFINQTFSNETGISSEKYLQADHYSRVMEPEEGIKCMLSDVRAFAADGPIHCEEELTNVDGSKHVYQIVKSKILSEDNEVSGLLGLAIDITDRKKAESDLKEALAVAEDSRDKIDNIIESIADGLIVTDTRNRIVLINQKARELLDMGSMDLTGEAIGWAIRDLSLLNQVNAIYDQNRKQALQTSFQPGSDGQGAGRFLQARTSLMRNKQSAVTGAITVLRDVTREQELDRIKSEFLSVAAHELRTPLTSILGYLEFCLFPEEFGGFSDEQQREFLQEINNKAEELARLVSDLLDIGRLEAGKPLPMDVRAVDLERLVGKVVEQFRLHSPRHRFEIDLQKNPAGSVRADEEKLVQVLENLLSNAVKYSPKDSLVRILGTVGDNVYQVSVEDRGIGMTAEQSARVFDKFYRADFSNTAARGLGVGMSIVRQIVESLGGAIWVESEKGQGTRVHFTVPIMSEKDEGT